MDQMDQDTARKLLEHGGTLVFIDLPIGSEFGIDLHVARVGEKFRGVKMIPAPGLHFIYYSAVNKRNQALVAPRTGFYKWFTPGEVVVKKWDPTVEDVYDKISDEEVNRFRAAARSGSIDQFLGAFQFDEHAKWVGLTDYISPTVLDRLNPRCGEIKSVTQFIPQKFRSSSSKHRSDVDASAVEMEALPSTSDADSTPRAVPDVDADGLSTMEVEPDSIINFTRIPGVRDRCPTNSTPEQITRHNIDSSYSLEQIFSTYNGNGEDVLGELQFAFVTFLCGQVYDAFEHWKSLLRVFCTSSDAIVKYSQFYCDFIRVLHFQLKEVPEDLFVDIVESNNFLVSYLRNFFSNLETTVGVGDFLKSRGLRFKENLTQKFKWDFDAEPDDEAPVVVYT